MKQKSHMVGIYVRLSNDDARQGESVSIENQKMLLSKFVKEQGWELKSTYCDDGYSGTNQNRPGFQRMLRDIENGVINTVMVKDLSRLGRNYLEVGNFTEIFLPENNCELISLSEQVDEMMVFRNWFNENHSKETSKKVKAVKKMCAEEGKFLGTYAPYGFKKDPENKHKLIIDENTAPIVQRIFEMRSEGKGFRAIASILNEDKIIPPRDYYYQNKKKDNPNLVNHLWNENTLKVILRNEAYIGHMVQGKVGTVSYKTRKITKKDKENWIRVEDTHDALISEALWRKVKDIDDKKYKPRNRTDGITSIYTGLLKCADCGFTMRNHTERGIHKDGSPYVYSSFICGNYARSGKSACTVHGIYENVLDEVVLESIRRNAEIVACNEQRIIENIIRLKNKETTSYRSTYTQEIKVYRDRLIKLDTFIQKLYEDRIDGDIPETTFKILLAKYEQERIDKEESVKLLEKKIVSIRQDYQDVNFWAATITQYANLEKLDASILLSLIDKIIIGEPKRIDGRRFCDIEIVYKYVGNVNWIIENGGELYDEAI